MEVFEFKTDLLKRLEVCLDVLSWDNVSVAASQVKNEWAYYIELQIEPAGFKALWKIPRVVCSELNLRYPTIVYGYVEQVLFKELKAIFIVEAVQNEDVHLPERNEVCLEDLWPTRHQENDALNVKSTAECIDNLRFFYKNVWMPWDTDSDDDQNWVEKHLESRIRFCYDLRQGGMKRALAAHIRTLLVEARYVQQRREYLEIDLSDDENDSASVQEEFLNNTSIKDKSQITDLMRLHLRLAMIRSEIEMLENPELRHVYEEIKFDGNKARKTQNMLQNSKQIVKCAYVVAQPATLQEQIDMLQLALAYMPADIPIQIYPSLESVLSVCAASDDIFLSPGVHTINFLEYLNENGRICGLIEAKSADKQVVITSHDDDSILLVFDGDFKLENLVLDCKLVRTGLLIKNGHVHMKNCSLSGDGSTSTQVAINCLNMSKLSMENCNVDNFATGVLLNGKCSMNNTTFKNCRIGIDVNNQAGEICLQQNNNIINCKTGIYANVVLQEENEKHVTLRDMEHLKK